ncbi:MAG: IPTL-CTERM sorting domain-containing protein [Xanthomonadales bacterium]|nr:IPTL-CTERM sorting domain-containing protein [Xanthomonadales bacterium]
MNKLPKLGNRLALTTALAGILLSSYGGRSAYAGSCVGAAGTYACSGVADATDTTQNLAFSGAMTVTTNAGFGIDTSVTGGTAMSIYHQSGSGGLTFTDANSAPITGANTGIYAVNYGDGALNITTTGAVTGNTGAGIYAYNYRAATDLSINAQGTVAGQRNGIITASVGAGQTTITTTAAVTGANEIGITARLGKYNNVPNAVSSFKLSGKGAGSKIQGGHPTSFGTNLSINSQATVTGGEIGISAFSSGSGFLSITTTAAVTGTNEIGITATLGKYNSVGQATASSFKLSGRGAGSKIQGGHPTYGTNLSINSQAAVTGGGVGISAFNAGSGFLSITTTAAVTGTNIYGISAISFSGADLTIDASDTVTGGYTGIRVANTGSGVTTITTTAAVIGNSSEGIFAYNGSASTDLTIGASDTVTGGSIGISGINRGSGVTTITTSAAITGGTDYAINTETDLGGNSIINLNAGTIVSATSAMGIQNDAGDSAITVATGASVVGSISLGDGSDDLTFAGGDFTGVTTFDGGDDADVADAFIDTLTFAGSSGLLVAADVINWENIVIEPGSVITFDGIENLVTPSLSSTGEVNLQDGVAGDTLTLSGDFTGGGTLSLDVVADDGSSGTDLLVVEGGIISGTTVLNIANAGGAGGQTAGNGILLVQVAGSSPAGSFSMLPFTVGGFNYQLVQVGQNWYLQSTHLTYPVTEIASPAAGGSVSCTPNPVDHGSSASCTAVANSGYTFVDWSGDCTGAGAGACDLTNVTVDQSVTANFTGDILEPVAIPTIGQWGTGLLAFLLGGMGWHRLRRRAG